MTETGDSILPMTAPASEIQRPLATVVGGGLLSAVFLTLCLLPARYLAFPQELAHVVVIDWEDRLIAKGNYYVELFL